MMLKYIQEVLQVLLKETSKSKVRTRKTKLNRFDIAKGKTSINPEILSPYVVNETHDVENPKELLRLKKTYDKLMEKFVSPRLELKISGPKTLEQANFVYIRKKYNILGSSISSIFSSSKKNIKKLSSPPNNHPDTDEDFSPEQEISFGWSGQLTDKHASSPKVEAAVYPQDIESALFVLPEIKDLSNYKIRKKLKGGLREHLSEIQEVSAQANDDSKLENHVGIMKKVRKEYLRKFLKIKDQKQKLSKETKTGTFLSHDNIQPSLTADGEQLSECDTLAPAKGKIEDNKESIVYTERLAVNSNEDLLADIGCHKNTELQAYASQPIVTVKTNRDEVNPDFDNKYGTEIRQGYASKPKLRKINSNVSEIPLKREDTFSVDTNGEVYNKNEMPEDVIVNTNDPKEYVVNTKSNNTKQSSTSSNAYKKGGDNFHKFCKSETNRISKIKGPLKNGIIYAKTDVDTKPKVATNTSTFEDKAFDKNHAKVGNDLLPSKDISALDKNLKKINVHNSPATPLKTTKSAKVVQPIESNQSVSSIQDTQIHSKLESPQTTLNKELHTKRKSIYSTKIRKSLVNQSSLTNIGDADKEITARNKIINPKENKSNRYNTNSATHFIEPNTTKLKQTSTSNTMLSVNKSEKVLYSRTAEKRVVYSPELKSSKKVIKAETNPSSSYIRSKNAYWILNSKNNTSNILNTSKNRKTNKENSKTPSLSTLQTTKNNNVEPKKIAMEDYFKFVQNKSWYFDDNLKPKDYKHSRNMSGVGGTVTLKRNSKRQVENKKHTTTILGHRNSAVIVRPENPITLNTSTPKKSSRTKSTEAVSSINTSLKTPINTPKTSNSYHHYSKGVADPEYHNSSIDSIKRNPRDTIIKVMRSNSLLDNKYKSSNSYFKNMVHNVKRNKISMRSKSSSSIKSNVDQITLGQNLVSDFKRNYRLSQDREKVVFEKNTDSLNKANILNKLNEDTATKSLAGKKLNSSNLKSNASQVKSRVQMIFDYDKSNSKKLHTKNIETKAVSLKMYGEGKIPTNESAFKSISQLKSLEILYKRDKIKMLGKSDSSVIPLKRSVKNTKTTPVQPNTFLFPIKMQSRSLFTIEQKTDIIINYMFKRYAATVSKQKPAKHSLTDENPSGKLHRMKALHNISSSIILMKEPTNVKQIDQPSSVVKVNSKIRQHFQQKVFQSVQKANVAVKDATLSTKPGVRGVEIKSNGIKDNVGNKKSPNLLFGSEKSNNGGLTHINAVSGNKDYDVEVLYRRKDPGNESINGKRVQEYKNKTGAKPSMQIKCEKDSLATSQLLDTKNNFSENVIKKVINEPKKSDCFREKISGKSLKGENANSISSPDSKCLNPSNGNPRIPVKSYKKHQQESINHESETKKNKSVDQMLPKGNDGKNLSLKETTSAGKIGDKSLNPTSMKKSFQDSKQSLVSITDEVPRKPQKWKSKMERLNGTLQLRKKIITGLIREKHRTNVKPNLAENHTTTNKMDKPDENNNKHKSVDLDKNSLNKENHSRKTLKTNQILFKNDINSDIVGATEKECSLKIKKPIQNENKSPELKTGKNLKLCLQQEKISPPTHPTINTNQNEKVLKVKKTSTLTTKQNSVKTNEPLLSNQYKDINNVLNPQIKKNDALVKETRSKYNDSLIKDTEIVTTHLPVKDLYSIILPTHILKNNQVVSKTPFDKRDHMSTKRVFGSIKKKVESSSLTPQNKTTDNSSNLQVAEQSKGKNFKGESGDTKSTTSKNKPLLDKHLPAEEVIKETVHKRQPSNHKKNVKHISSSFNRDPITKANTYSDQDIPRQDNKLLVPKIELVITGTTTNKKTLAKQEESKSDVSNLNVIKDSLNQKTIKKLSHLNGKRADLPKGEDRSKVSSSSLSSDVPSKNISSLESITEISQKGIVDKNKSKNENNSEAMEKSKSLNVTGSIVKQFKTQTIASMSTTNRPSDVPVKDKNSDSHIPQNNKVVNECFSQTNDYSINKNRNTLHEGLLKSLQLMKSVENAAVKVSNLRTSANINTRKQLQKTSEDPNRLKSSCQKKSLKLFTLSSVEVQRLNSKIDSNSFSSSINSATIKNKKDVIDKKLNSEMFNFEQNQSDNMLQNIKIKPFELSSKHPEHPSPSKTSFNINPSPVTMPQPAIKENNISSESAKRSNPNTTDLKGYNIKSWRPTRTVTIIRNEV